MKNFTELESWVLAADHVGSIKVLIRVEGARILEGTGQARGTDVGRGGGRGLAGRRRRLELGGVNGQGLNRGGNIDVCGGRGHCEGMTVSQKMIGKKYLARDEILMLEEVVCLLFLSSVAFCW